MPKGSKKKQSSPYRIDTGELSSDIIPAKKPVIGDEKASVILRHYVKNFECFSKWSPDELKAFSRFVEKMNSRTQAQITIDTKFCHAHKGTQKRLPSTLSPEQKVFSLDVTGAGRAHGVFSVDGKFFLVWLDRKGQILGH